MRPGWPACPPLGTSASTQFRHIKPFERGAAPQGTILELAVPRPIRGIITQIEGSHSRTDHPEVGIGCRRGLRAHQGGIHEQCLLIQRNSAVRLCKEIVAV